MSLLSILTKKIKTYYNEHTIIRRGLMIVTLTLIIIFPSIVDKILEHFKFKNTYSIEADYTDFGNRNPIDEFKSITEELTKQIDIKNLEEIENFFKSIKKINSNLGNAGEGCSR